MRRAFVAIAVASLIGACSATVSFSDEVVAAEAAWLCDVPRYAYDDAASIDAELSKRLEIAGIERSTYDAFKTALERNADLRVRVSDAYVASCQGG